ncbi:MAG TPA: pseudaminic acid cytidylyltransferase, partial [Nitrospira sp.]|nr:pseudaminic acid cytidylyltransferase [Nitrospira sp.]
EAAKNVGVIDRVYVSTDDDEIARVAESYGAETPTHSSPQIP